MEEAGREKHEQKACKRAGTYELDVLRVIILLYGGWNGSSCAGNGGKVDLAVELRLDELALDDSCAGAGSHDNG